MIKGIKIEKCIERMDHSDNVVSLITTIIYERDKDQTIRSNE